MLIKLNMQIMNHSLYKNLSQKKCVTLIFFILCSITELVLDMDKFGEVCRNDNFFCCFSTIEPCIYFQLICQNNGVSIFLLIFQVQGVWMLFFLIWQIKGVRVFNTTRMDCSWKLKYFSQLKFKMAWINENEEHLQLKKYTIIYR